MQVSIVKSPEKLLPENTSLIKATAGRKSKNFHGTSSFFSVAVVKTIEAHNAPKDVLLCPASITFRSSSIS